MFHNIGWTELVLLGVVGLIIFGPDRLPKVASDAVRMLRELRTMARGAAADLKAELGPEMADLDLASLHPRRIVGSILNDDEPVPARVATPVASALQRGKPPPNHLDATCPGAQVTGVSASGRPPSVGQRPPISSAICRRATAAGES